MPKQRPVTSWTRKAPRQRRHRHLGEEERIQRTVVQWLRANDVYFWHTPNEGRRSEASGRRLKAMGMLAGVSDLLILDPPPNVPGCRLVAIELKSAKGRPTNAQLAFIMAVNERGGMGRVCRGVDETIALLDELGYGQH